MTDLTSDAAKTLSELGAAQGGKARANVLTPEQRSEIARKAVTARWAKAGKKQPQRVEAGTANADRAVVIAGQIKPNRRAGYFVEGHNRDPIFLVRVGDRRVLGLHFLQTGDD